MKLVVQKSCLKGTIAIPGSKSHTIRAIAMGSLAEGESIIKSPLLSSDTCSAVRCYRALGAQIDTSSDDKWKIIGTGGKIKYTGEKIDVGNSGTTLRVAVGSAGLSDGDCDIMLDGDEQIRSRPIGPLLRSLEDLGAKTKSNLDKAPVIMTGGLKGGKTTIECITSQYLSSLLLLLPKGLPSFFPEAFIALKASLVRVEISSRSISDAIEKAIAIILL